MTYEKWPRRSLISGLSASLGAFVFGSNASAQTKGSFQPSRHAQDEWLDKLPGQHRVFIDTASPSGAAEGMQYANNLFTANDSGYGLGDGDLAIVLCLRHQSAVFAFSDAIW